MLDGIRPARRASHLAVSSQFSALSCQRSVISCSVTTNELACLGSAIANDRTEQPIQNFRNLIVWRKSHSLVLEVYAKTAKFPRSEMFGLAAQTRRAAVSIAANIAEGSARSSDKEFARFLYISLGSASEIEYLSILAGVQDRSASNRNQKDVNRTDCQPSQSSS